MLLLMAFPFFGRRRSSGERRHRDDQSSVPFPLGVMLAEEAEAFLAGRLADHLVATGRSVPAWALLNRLAHGGLPLVAACCVPGEEGWRSHPSMGAPHWPAAERSLALRMLASAPRPDELRHLQSRALVPLESRLIERSRAEILSPGEVIGLASDAVDQHLLDH